MKYILQGSTKDGEELDMVVEMDSEGEGNMVRVLNKRTDTITPNAVYVGRPSKWGNPFKINDPLMPPHLTREEKQKAVVDEYRRYILANPELMSQLAELKGKDLVCWCSPLPCHADVLLSLSNQGNRG